ncbi:MAG: YccF domain-containing protein [Thermomicrobiales bacterium]|nr:YccF domain-containing protein [Thermomicrobiales bacterium]
MPNESHAESPALFDDRGPNLLFRVIWFIFIGWWLGGILSGVAWFFNATIIGLPVGLWIINRLPTFITLRPQEQTWRLDEGRMVRGRGQRSFVLRSIYFLLVGWWFSGVWMAVAYVFLLSIVGFPIAFWMYGRVGAVTTLFRS